MLHGRGRPARPGARRRRSSPAQPARSTSRSARAATSSTSTSTAARSAASATPRATSRRRRSRSATPTSGRGAADGRPSTARGSSDPDAATRSPTPGTSTATARSTTRRRPQPTFTYTQRGHATPRGCGSPTATGATATDAVTITVGQHAADADDRRAVAGHHLEGRRRRSPSPARRPTRRTARCRPRRSRWSLIMHHCPSNCHAHPVQTFAGVASGSFAAPDHEYPSHLELRLTATDSDGASRDRRRVRLDPQTVDLTFDSEPVRASSSRSAATAQADAVHAHGDRRLDELGERRPPQTLGGDTTRSPRWSDGGAQTHTIVGRRQPGDLHGDFDVAGAGGLVGAYGFDEATGRRSMDSLRQREQRHAHARHAHGERPATAPPSPSTASTTGSRSTTRTRSTYTGAMTLEAWVNPAALGAGPGARSLMKERSRRPVLRALREHGHEPPERARVHRRRRPRRARHGPGRARDVDAPRRHLRRRRPALYVNGTLIGDAGRGRARSPTATGALRIGGNSALGRVLQRPHRRGARLQQRADGGPDPDRHDDADRDADAGHHAADRDRRRRRPPTRPSAGPSAGHGHGGRRRRRARLQSRSTGSRSAPRTRPRRQPTGPSTGVAGRHPPSAPWRGTRPATRAWPPT